MANKLTVNLSKSNMILVTPKNLNNKVKTKVFKSHIKMFTNKLSNAIVILNTVKTYLNKPALLSLYYAFFYSQLYYGLLTWSLKFHSYYNIITTLQNKQLNMFLVVNGAIELHFIIVN